MKKRKYLLLGLLSVILIGTAVFAGDIEMKINGATDAVTIDKSDGSEAMRVTAEGNVGIGTTTPTATLDVKGLFKVDTEEKVVQTSQYVKEFSGVIKGPGNYPACTDPAKVITLGTIKDSDYQSFIEVELYGSHRGHNQTVYFEYKKWVIMAGDKVSSHVINSAGTSNKVELFDGTIEGNFNNIEIGAGFDIRLNVKPQCGSNMNYTYVVHYYSAANFTPHATRYW